MINAIYKIGKAVSAKQEPIDCLLKQVNAKNEKKDKNGNVIKIKNYILKIVFDLNDNKIILSSDNLLIFDPAKSKKYTYCGNNGRREKQFYLTRDLKSVGYLFGKTLNDLIDKLKAEYANYKDNRLYKITKKIVESSLYNKQNKEILHDGIEKVKKEYLKLTPTQLTLQRVAVVLIQKLVELAHNEQIVLITPTVVDSDGETNLAEMEEYKNLVLTKLQLKPSKKSKNENNFCYLCKDSKASSSDNLKKLNMKFFTTTTINSASGINKKYYDKNYRICTDCLEMLKAAEGFIENNMRVKIAGTPTYLIPNILSFHEEIEPDYLEKLYSKIDLAFNEWKYKNFIESVEYSFENDETDFCLDFLSFETDGNYFKVINHVHDVPKFYFIRLTKIIAGNYYKYEREIKGMFENVFCLGSIYRLIPIKYKKDGSLSAKKNRALLFYNQLLGENKIERDMVFSYFCEAIYHLYMNQQNVYKNLQGYKEEHFDFAIKDYFYRYLVLIRSLEDLNLIVKGVEIMGETDFKSSGDIEKFLSENNYDEQRRALFYLGILINQVGYKQSLQGHKKKPILKKISYQGMSVDDLKRLYVDVFEKLVQYGEFKYPSVEGFNTLCKLYFDKAIAAWNLSEFENVFYLLSGYAYKVANTKDESDTDNNQSTGEK